jgi:hypothetical protein
MNWQYRRVEVVGDEIIDIPKGAKCRQITPVRGGRTSCVEWLEPVQEGEQ